MTRSLPWAIGTFVAFLVTTVVLFRGYQAVQQLMVLGEDGVLVVERLEGVTGRGGAKGLYAGSIDGTSVRVVLPHRTAAAGRVSVFYNGLDLILYQRDARKPFREFVIGSRSDGTWAIFKRSFSGGDEAELTAALIVWAVLGFASVYFYLDHRKVRAGGAGASAPPRGSEHALALIRSLVKKRLLEDPVAAGRGYTPDMVDQLPAHVLAGLPEASLVSIVQMYAGLKASRHDDLAAFREIERARSSIASGRLPESLDLARYVAYRVRLEHSGEGAVPSQHIEDGVLLARTLFRC